MPHPCAVSSRKVGGQETQFAFSHVETLKPAPKDRRVAPYPPGCSQILEYFFLRHALVRSNRGKDRIQRSDSQRRMRGDGDPVVRRIFGLQNNVAADLMNLGVLPMLREVFDQVLAAQVAWQPHATARTSSRTRRKRIDAGGAESK